MPPFSVNYGGVILATDFDAGRTGSNAPSPKRDVEDCPVGVVMSIIRREAVIECLAAALRTEPHRGVRHERNPTREAHRLALLHRACSIFCASLLHAATTVRAAS